MFNLKSLKQRLIFVSLSGLVFAFGACGDADNSADSVDDVNAKGESAKEAKSCYSLKSETVCESNSACQWIPDDFPFPGKKSAAVCIKKSVTASAVAGILPGEFNPSGLCALKGGKCNPFCPAGVAVEGEGKEVGCSDNGFAGPDKCCKVSEDTSSSEGKCGTIVGGFVGYLKVDCPKGQECVGGKEALTLTGTCQKQNSTTECVKQGGYCSSTCGSDTVIAVEGLGCRMNGFVGTDKCCKKLDTKLSGTAGDCEKQGGHCSPFCANGVIAGEGQLGCQMNGFAGADKCCKNAQEETPDNEICGEIIGGFVGYLKINCKDGATCVKEEGELLGVCQSMQN